MSSSVLGGTRETRLSPRKALLIAGLALLLPVGSALAGPPAAVVSDAPNDKREVAITIDDGYDVKACKRMVRTLREMDVTATFFPTGRAVQLNPKFWRNVARDFPIANHTGFHGNLPALPDSKVRLQIKSAEWNVKQATGKPLMKVLRPPGGAWDDRVRRIAGDLGYRALMMWDVSSADTGLRSKPKGMIRAATRGGKGSVILMHCNRQISADILPDIIKIYQDRGFRFVTVDRILERRGITIPGAKARKAQQEQAKREAERKAELKAARKAERKAARKAARQAAEAQAETTGVSQPVGALTLLTAPGRWLLTLEDEIERWLSSMEA